MMKHTNILHQSSPARLWVSEEETQPLPTLAGLAFQVFLAKHELSLLAVARAAGVPMLTIWRITHNAPIARWQAAMVRAGLSRLTGVQYRGGILLRRNG